jgi:hypothetical protein
MKKFFRAPIKEVRPITLLWYTACVNVGDRTSSENYCLSLSRFVNEANSSAACGYVLLAGCIPVLIECLRRWSREAMGHRVVEYTCQALCKLASKGDDSVRAAIKAAPGIKELLEGAKTISEHYPQSTLESIGL